MITKPFLIFSLVSFLFIFSLSLVSAESQIQTLGKDFPRYESINLIQNCINSTYSNISRVTYPNSTFAINQQTSMVKVGSDYSYQFNKTDALGEYLIYGQCDENGVTTNWAYNLFVKGGNMSLFLVIILGSIIILGFAFFAENEWLGFIAGIGFIIAGIYVMIYGLEYRADMYTRTISFICIGLGFLFEIAAGYKVAEETRGFSNR